MKTWKKFLEVSALDLEGPTEADSASYYSK